MTRFDDQAAVARAFEGQGYISTGNVSTAVFLAESLQKPLLVEGPPGVGKTELAKVWAQCHDLQLIRLQCYEGLDESKALYEWSYARQLLYAQLLREKTGDLLEGTRGLAEAVARLHGEADHFFGREFLLERPLLQAIVAGNRAVLLIDEVDRSDAEFEAFLLEVLSDYQVTIPELGTIAADSRPRVLLTSNDSRDLSDALRRRCLYLHIDYPSPDDEAAILERRVPDLDAELAQRVVRFAAATRRADLKKTPGTAEVIDWALALTALGAPSLDAETLRRTLGALLKNRRDLERVLDDLPRFRG